MGVSHVGLAIFVTYGAVVRGYGEVNSASIVLLEVAQRAALMLDLVAGRCASGRVVDREVRCLNPLRIKGGTTFYYDSQLVLTIVEIMLVQSVNLLIIR